MYKYWKEKQIRGVKLSQSWPRLNTWTADASRFWQAWCWDALCMYIGLLMGEPWEAEPIRNPSQDIDLIQTFQLIARQFYVSDGYFCHSIVAFCVNLM